LLSPTDAEAGKSGGITLGSVNNEPVAWMAHDNSGASLKCTDEFCIPLYTHPHSYQSVKAKTLTDEEILQQALFSFGNESENFDDSYWIGFARAILKKASEK
jgi:hypothetical protein